MEYCSYVLAGVPNFYLDLLDKLRNLVYSIARA